MQPNILWRERRVPEPVAGSASRPVWIGGITESSGPGGAQREAGEPEDGAEGLEGQDHVGVVEVSEAAEGEAVVEEGQEGEGRLSGAEVLVGLGTRSLWLKKGRVKPWSWEKKGKEAGREFTERPGLWEGVLQEESDNAQ